MATFFNSGSFQAQGNATTTVGKASAPTRLYSFHVISGATAGTVNLHSSTNLTTPWMAFLGTINTGRNVTFGEKGILFPAGLTVINDANVTTVLFNISQ